MARQQRSLQDQLQTLIDPVVAPAMIRVTYNETVTTLRKITREDGTTFWAGTPVSQVDGRHCRYALTIDPSGFISGSAAVNFITSKGWRPGNKKSTGEEKARAAVDFRRAFIQACVMMTGVATSTAALADQLAEQTGLQVMPGEIDVDGLEMLALMGIPHDAVAVAKSNGLTFNLDVAAYIARHVQPTYAVCEPGEWNAECEEVAITSSLTAGQVFLLRARGMSFRKLEIRSRRG